MSPISIPPGEESGQPDVEHLLDHGIGMLHE